MFNFTKQSMFCIEKRFNFMPTFLSLTRLTRDFPIFNEYNRQCDVNQTFNNKNNLNLFSLLAADAGNFLLQIPEAFQEEHHPQANEQNLDFVQQFFETTAMICNRCFEESPRNVDYTVQSKFFSQMPVNKIAFVFVVSILQLKSQSDDDKSRKMNDVLCRVWFMMGSYRLIAH